MSLDNLPAAILCCAGYGTHNGLPPFYFDLDWHSERQANTRFQRPASANHPTTASDSVRGGR